jgi:hypothetical protein
MSACAVSVELSTLTHRIWRRSARSGNGAARANQNDRMREHSITVHGNKFGINPKGNIVVYDCDQKELGTVPAAVLNKIIVHAQAVAQMGWPDKVKVGYYDYVLDYELDGAVNFGDSRTYSLDELKRIQKLSRAVKGHRTNKQNKPKL